MQLNREDKDKLREYIEGRINEIPYGQRLQLDKEILESLLFEPITINKEKGLKLKLPIWSGDFLKKIDLSQVDFTNVSWGIQGMDEDSPYSIDIDGVKVDYGADKRIKGIVEREAKKYHEKVEGEEDDTPFLIDYSGTNAKIDLEKSFEAVNEGVIKARACNFSGLDFSNIDLSKYKEIWLSTVDLSGTKIKIPRESNLKAYCSNFDGIDLSSRTINARRYLLEEASDNLPGCNLHNTAINITLDPTEFKTRDEDWEEKVQSAMKNYWVGCYVNGKKVLSESEQLEMATNLKKQYEAYQENIYKELNSQIEEAKRRR